MAGTEPGEDSRELAALRRHYRRPGGERSVRARWARLRARPWFLSQPEVNKLQAEAGGEGCLTFSCFGENFQIRAGGFGNDFRVSGVDGGEIDKIAADSKCARAGLDEARRGLECDSASGDELEIRKRRE